MVDYVQSVITALISVGKEAGATGVVNRMFTRAK